jgi:hypothetical protein
MKQDKNEEGKGFTVDLEMKVLLITMIFSILKFLKSNNWYLVSICWLFFIVGHFFFYYCFVKTSQLINLFIDLSTEEKTKAQEKCQLLFRDLMSRGVMVIIFHYSTTMVAPLIISVFMGCFSMIENYNYYEFLYRKYPIIFENFFY